VLPKTPDFFLPLTMIYSPYAEVKNVCGGTSPFIHMFSRRSACLYILPNVYVRS
jgi:hypothetical protein